MTIIGKGNSLPVFHLQITGEHLFGSPILMECSLHILVFHCQITPVHMIIGPVNPQ